MDPREEPAATMLPAVMQEPLVTEPVIAPPPKPKLIVSSQVPVGSVRVILTNNLKPAPGKRVEIAELGARYREVCKAEGRRATSMTEFIDAVEKFCEDLRLKRRSVAICEQ